MIKALVSDSLLYTVSQSLFQGLPILLLPLFLRTMTPEDYGVYELSVIAVMLINLTIPLEIAQGLARHYADAKDDAEKKLISSTSLWFTIACYGTFGLCAVLLASILLDQFGLTHAEYASVAGAAITFGVFLLLQQQLRWDMRAKQFFATSLVYTFVAAGFAAYGLLVANLGWKSVFLAQALASVLAGCVAFALSRNRYGLAFDSAILPRLLQFSVPLIPSSIFIWVNASIDRVFLEGMIGLAAVGLYGAAFRIASSINFCLVGLSAALTPHLYRNYRDPDMPAQTALIFCWVAWVLAVVVLAFFLLSGEIFQILAPAGYEEAASLLGLLSLSAVMSRLYIFAPGLDIAKKTWRIAIINAIACTVNIVCNLAFIPTLGLLGACYATVLSSILMFVLYILQSQKHYPIPYPWLRLSGLAGLATALILLFQNVIFDSSVWSGLPIKLAALAVFAIVGRYILALRGPRGVSLQGSTNSI